LSLTDYTSEDQVRAALGVSEFELEDGTINLEVYTTGLKEDLYEVDPGLVSRYEEVSALDEEARTPQQARFYSLTRLFSTYSVARQLGGALSMFAPKTLGDSKASFSRHADSPYKDTLLQVNKLFEQNRVRLSEAYKTLVSSETARSQRVYLAGIAPAVDPVTGEGF
jgi:hypothetical protein